jgi:predicted chitinase
MRSYEFIEEDLNEGLGKNLAALGLAGALTLGGVNKNIEDTVPYNPIKQTTQQEPVINKPKSLSKINPAVAKKLETSNLAKYLYQAAVNAGIKGAELAQFLAQTSVETQHFTNLKEVGGKNDFKKYDIRFNPEKAKILGNTKPGDGAKFCGRGALMVTGKYNYQKVGDALGIDLVHNPKLLENPKISAKAAVYYWKNRVQPKITDWNDTKNVTRVINSGLHNLDMRQQYFDFWNENI